MLLMLGTLTQSHAQYLVQTLTVNLTAYDTPDNRAVRIVGVPKFGP